MTYKQAMNYIKRPYTRGDRYNLNTMIAILEKLDNPHKKIKCIHIAGTNGKGSTSVITAKILQYAGYKTGLYTSPYILEFEERIQINSKKISKDDLARIITKIASTIEELDISPTEFEIITCAMFYYYAKQNVDYAVIEVGLGGLTDCTNVITPILSVITSISLDHTQILGDTIEKIAMQKAGIIKQNVPTILYNQNEKVLNVIKKVCEEKNSMLTITDYEIKNYTDTEIEKIFGAGKTKNSAKQYFNLKTKKDSYDISLNLLGTHQIKNASVVIGVAEALINQGINIKKNDILSALDTVIWIGRLEIMNKEPLVVLDGAHNIDGITTLIDNIKKYFTYKKIILINGILKDKQIDDMVEKLASLADKIITVDVDNYRSASGKQLADIFKKYNTNVEYISDPKKAYELSLSLANADDMVLIAGSLYLIGDFRKICMTYQ